jgi:P-type E1-E2 ATPase
MGFFRVFNCLKQRRYVQDLTVNSTPTLRWNAERERFEESNWKELVVGDVILMKENEECPADIVVLQTSSDQGLCHVQTANLDGETNIKLKRAVACTYEIECAPDGSDYPLYFSGILFISVIL